MAKNPLFELYEAGTSVWLDYIRRSLMTSGELKRMIEEDAVVGMTSNPPLASRLQNSSDHLPKKTPECHCKRREAISCLVLSPSRLLPRCARRNDNKT